MLGSIGRRGVATVGLGLFLLAGFGTSAVLGQQDLPSLPAQNVAMKLFKIITPKDEIVIGLPDAELRSFGQRPDVDNLADRLISAGQVSAWQYTIRKASDGSLVQAPQHRVAVFRTETLRIEPFNPAPLKVLPPDQPSSAAGNG